MKRTRQFVTLRARPRKPPAPAASALPVGCSVTASSEQDGAGAKNANDGSVSTRWAADSGAFPQAWTVDLGATASLKDVRIDWYSGTAPAYGYRIEVSTDGVAFATAVDRSKNKTAGATTDAVSAQARYVRVQVLGATATSAWASANEITVRGIPASTPVPTPTPTATPTPTSTPTPESTPTPGSTPTTHADARSDSGPHTDTQSDSRPHTDADVDSYRDADPYVHSHTDTDSHTDVNSDAHADADFIAFVGYRTRRVRRREQQRQRHAGWGVRLLCATGSRTAARLWRSRPATP